MLLSSGLSAYFSACMYGLICNLHTILVSFVIICSFFNNNNNNIIIIIIVISIICSKLVAAPKRCAPKGLLRVSEAPSPRAPRSQGRTLALSSFSRKWCFCCFPLYLMIFDTLLSQPCENIHLGSSTPARQVGTEETVSLGRCATLRRRVRSGPGTRRLALSRSLPVFLAGRCKGYRRGRRERRLWPSSSKLRRVSVGLSASRAGPSHADPLRISRKPPHRPAS